jgi:hypothetical protein
MPEFIASPHTAAGALTEQATGTALKTLLQVGIPAATFIEILGWGFSDTGVSATDAPGEVYLMEGDVAASVGTSLTPDTYDTPGGQASLCVGGAALTCYGPTTEGTIAATRLLDQEKVHPQTGYSVWFPSDARPRCGLVASARYVRLRCNFAVSYNATCWIAWIE